MTKEEKEKIEKELNSRIQAMKNEKKESSADDEAPEAGTEELQESKETEEVQDEPETEEKPKAEEVPEPDEDLKSKKERKPKKKRKPKEEPKPEESPEPKEDPEPKVDPKPEEVPEPKKNPKSEEDTKPETEASKAKSVDALEKLRIVLLHVWAVLCREARGFGREAAAMLSKLWKAWAAEFRYIRDASKAAYTSLIEKTGRELPDKRTSGTTKTSGIEGNDFRTVASELADRFRKDISDKSVRRMLMQSAAASLGVLIVLVIAGRAPAISSEEAFIAAASNDAAVYTISEDTVAETGRLIRGTAVNKYNVTEEIDGVTYVRIDEAAAEDVETASSSESPDEEYKYVKEENLAETADDVVREKEVFVRTPATIYAEAEGPAIASFAPKSSRFDVTGYDRINPDGRVNRYRISYTGGDGQPAEGYVYGKYMTDTQEKADAVYNENGIYDKAKKDKYSFNLYGGKASHLDYYPYEKPVIEGKEFCSDARAMYLNCAAVVNYKPYVKLVKSSGCNAVVLDIKDGVLAYKSKVAKEMSPHSYKTAYVSVDEYKAGVDAYRETGAYLIGRIVVFNDPIYAKDHPENCIKYAGSTDWPSGFSRGVWEYNVRLAQEAIREFGFDEIQFDYVRFPESSYEMSKSGEADFRNKYGEEKGQAIQNFCLYAADQIHEAGAYFSIDVFGESAYGYMTAYGQYWPGLSNIVDAISAMPYTDHMGVDGGWENPYGIMKSWGKKAKKQQKKLEHPAVARTWITGYDTPHWDPVVNYGPAELKAQIKGLEAAGLHGGFIPWNAASSYEKYSQYSSIWAAGE